MLIPDDFGNICSDEFGKSNLCKFYLPYYFSVIIDRRILMAFFDGVCYSAINQGYLLCFIRIEDKL